MTLAGFEPAIPASEKPQNVALDRSATGIGSYFLVWSNSGHGSWVAELRNNGNAKQVVVDRMGEYL